MQRIQAAILSLLAIGLGIQLVPYGREHVNPEATHEPEWNAPETRETFFRVCKDCHSNQTEWPWYSFVAPASWLVQRDVRDGRSHFNVSEWGRAKNHGDEAEDLVRKAEMPPWFYVVAHRAARLSEAERKDFAAGLAATFAEEPAAHRHDH